MATYMKRPDIGESWSIVLPTAWRTAPWQACEVLATKTMPDDHKLMMVSGCLADGTNIFALLYPGGSKLLRSGPPTDWVVEESQRGRPPWERHRSDVEEFWQFTIRLVADAHEKATEQERNLPADELRAQYLESTLLAFTSAMRIVADCLAACDGDEEIQQDQLERLKRGIYDCVRLGATRAQLAAAVAAAKEGRGPDQQAILDAIVQMVIDLPPRVDDAPTGEAAA